LQAFFVEGQDIGSIDVLTRLASEVGLDEREFGEALRTRKYREAHQRALRHAYEGAGVTGFPMFVIGD
jgi:predicted DsbA family dithiol-disulfide isomerase